MTPPGPKASKCEIQPGSLLLLLTAIVPVSVPQFPRTCPTLLHFSANPAVYVNAGSVASVCLSFGYRRTRELLANLHHSRIHLECIRLVAIHGTGTKRM